ncbi:hypothetical protein ACOJUR_00950 [Alicyclobacillus tolerans]|uniref:hypothetical protein n=1 Tax=Alicyclobacillus tolerans TaxID=90970 RepID=UPI003B7FC858
MNERRERRRREKTVRHGDLIHIYIASDTPQEVVNFINQLKSEGDFSYEILRIVEQHLKQSRIMTSDTTVDKVKENIAMEALESIPVRTDEKQTNVTRPSVENKTLNQVTGGESITASTDEQSVSQSHTAETPASLPMKAIEALRRQRMALVQQAPRQQEN